MREAHFLLARLFGSQWFEMLRLTKHEDHEQQPAKQQTHLFGGAGATKRKELLRGKTFELEKSAWFWRPARNARAPRAQFFHNLIITADGWAAAGKQMVVAVFFWSAAAPILWFAVYCYTPKGLFVSWGERNIFRPFSP
jgi:hypothetical protein